MKDSGTAENEGKISRIQWRTERRRKKKEERMDVNTNP
jgi:hypothetical protein